MWELYRGYLYNVIYDEPMGNTFTNYIVSPKSLKNKPTILFTIQGDLQATLCISRIDHRQLLIASENSSVIWVCEAGKFSMDKSLIIYIMSCFENRGSDSFESLFITSNFSDHKVIFSQNSLKNSIDFLWTITSIRNEIFVLPDFI